LFVVYLLLGLIALVGGAELLVRGGGELALRLRIPAVVVGLTVVAFGTSTPELAVSVAAALRASTEMALANVNGSNIANVALVLGIGAMVRPLRVERALLRREVPACTLLVLMVPLFLLDHRISRIEGIALLLVGLAYNAWLLRDALRGRAQVPEAEDIHTSLLVEVAMLVGGLVVLVFGADLFVSGAVDVASRLGLSDRYIGLTVVAVGTSAPEIATAVVSAYRGKVELAVGNSLGSNILNISMVLGVTSMIYPIEMIDTKAWWDILVVLIVLLSLIPMVVKDSLLSRGEGAVLVLGYVTYLILSSS